MSFPNMFWFYPTILFSTSMNIQVFHAEESALTKALLYNTFIENYGVVFLENNAIL